MKNLIIDGDPGIRTNAVIEYEDEEYICFSVKRQGDWHGPERVQLWCTIGIDDEREAFEYRDYIPMHLDTIRAESEDITVVSASSDLAV